MKIFLAALCVLLAIPVGAAEPLLVAAASDLTYCIDELVAAFRQDEHGVEVKVSLGASGNFFVQLKHGAPFEQGAIVTAHGKAKPQAARFVPFLRSRAARAILLRSGFGLTAAPHG